MYTYRNIIGWALSIYLAAELAIYGIGKILMKPALIASYASYGYPPWFLYTIGCLELFAAVLCLIPRYTALGAALAAGVMLGAVFADFIHGLGSSLTMPLVLLIASLMLLFVRTSRPAAKPLDAPLT